VSPRARWLLGLVCAVGLAGAAAALLPACTDCDSPPPDACVPSEGSTLEDTCVRCGSVYHTCRDGKWVPVPCGPVGPPERDR
jgi:hypothetical protein